MQKCKYPNLPLCRPILSLNVCQFFSVSTRLMAIGLVLMFANIIWWLKYRGIDIKQEISTFLNFFPHFLTIFANFPNIWLFGPFGSFCISHGWPPSPVTPISTFMSPVLNQTMRDIPNGFYQQFSDNFMEVTIFPFLAILKPQDPPYGVCMAMSEIAHMELKLIDNAYIILSWGILDLHANLSTSGHFGHP